MIDQRAVEHPAPGTTQPLPDALAAENMQPLWDRYKSVLTLEPQSYEPCLWPWTRTEGLIDRAAGEVSMAEAERRVLLLTPPGFPGTIYTTPTLSAGLQILNPGESAHPHRHTLAALRLVMSGDGAETITDGKVCPMKPGDLILTPSMTWHEHRHRGTSRMVWFDGLDYPLARSLGTIFFEPHPPADGLMLVGGIADECLSQGGVLPDGDDREAGYSPLLRYEWTRVDGLLDAVPPAADGARRIRYVNPVDGGAVMPTIDCFALRLGEAPTRRMRTSSTAIAVVIEGEGETSIGDTVFRWRPHDVFTLPRWKWIEHRRLLGPATLFLMTDRALMRRIGHLREEADGED